MEYIGLDIHRHYAVLARMDQQGTLIDRRRVDHEALPAYLQALPEPPRLAFEATCSWYSVCDLVEPWAAEVVLSHPLKTDRFPVPPDKSVQTVGKMLNLQRRLSFTFWQFLNGHRITLFGTCKSF